MTRDELRDFKASYGAARDVDLAKKFKVTIRRVRVLAGVHRLGKDKTIFQDRPMPRWSKEEVRALRRLYPSHDNVSVARRLGRTVKSVAAKAHRLGLDKLPARLEEMGRENVALRRDR